jgi:hypothetical protein
LKVGRLGDQVTVGVEGANTQRDIAKKEEEKDSPPWREFLAYFPYFQKNKSRFIRKFWCLYVCMSPFINFRMPEPIFMKLGM